MRNAPINAAPSVRIEGPQGTLNAVRLYGAGLRGVRRKFRHDRADY